jgi:hypothetical protein
LGHDREVVIPEKVDHAEIRNTTHLQLPVTQIESRRNANALCSAPRRVRYLCLVPQTSQESERK